AANLTLTAYGLMEFQDMDRVHDVDLKLLIRTENWIWSKRNRDGSWSPESHGLHDDPTRGGDLARLSTTAYVAWAAFRGQGDFNNDLTVDYLLSFRPQRIDDPYVLALVCNALLRSGYTSQPWVPYLERLEKLKHASPDGKRVWWQQNLGGRTTFYGSGMSGAVETTALAALAMLKAKEYP